MNNNDIVPGFDYEKDDSLSISLQKIYEEPSCLVVHLNGYFGTYNSNCFQRRVAKIVESGFTRLICDCTGLIFTADISFSGFPAAREAVRSRGGDLILLNLPPQFRESIDILGFAELFNIKKNLEEAVAFFYQ